MDPHRWDCLKVYYRPVVRRGDFLTLSPEARWEQLRATIAADTTPSGQALQEFGWQIGQDATHRNEVLDYLERAIVADAT
jgi:hypothetical protein